MAVTPSRDNADLKRAFELDKNYTQYYNLYHFLHEDLKMPHWPSMPDTCNSVSLLCARVFSYAKFFFCWFHQLSPSRILLYTVHVSKAFQAASRSRSRSRSRTIYFSNISQRKMNTPRRPPSDDRPQNCSCFIRLALRLRQFSTKNPFPWPTESPVLREPTGRLARSRSRSRSQNIYIFTVLRATVVRTLLWRKQDTVPDPCSHAVLYRLRQVLMLGT